MKQKFSVDVPGMNITLSTGTIAKQSNGAVTIGMGDTSLLVTATAASSIRPGQDFFPLTVDYREKFAAAGRFPGGFFKREARPSEKEILTSRLCDRPLRPLFPKGFLNEVQVIGLLLSCDKINEPDILMVNGASAALMISDIPWEGPVGCIRLGEIDGEFVVNPSNEEIFESTLDLIYVGNEKEMMMIEGSADEISEERFCEALEYAHQAIQPIIVAQKELAEKVGNTKTEFDLVIADPEILETCRSYAAEKLVDAIFTDSKQEREKAVDVIKEEAAAIVLEKIGEDAFDKDQISMSFEVLQEEVYRNNILELGKRADGRAAADLREISCETGVLPKVHGSSLFNRGETQALVLTTLGTSRDTQDIDGLTGGATSKSFLLHYNFPPYSVGEAGFMSGPKRREIGHGKLARRGVSATLPNSEDFPYTVRVVSEITESNGSSSMASVCGTSLALMDAGVPVKAPVAGVAMGLVKEGNRYAVLTDILGDEDHLGDMDFKVAGTAAGVTALQMDIKIDGITEEIMEAALAQAFEARVHILDEMNKVISASREELSDNAPAMVTLHVHPDKIRDIIGKGGATIRSIVEETGAEVDINDDGSVRIYAEDGAAKDAAVNRIQEITAEAEVGRIYKGKVERIVDFGAFVNILPGKDGLLHISQIAEERVENVTDYLSEGQEVEVVVLDVDQRGRIKLSIKELENYQEAQDSEE